MEKKTAKGTINIIYGIKLGSQDAMEKALETFEPIISKYVVVKLFCNTCG